MSTLAGVVDPALTFCRKSYYDILNVPRGADEAQIKRAYRKLAVQYHPVSLSPPLRLLSLTLAKLQKRILPCSRHTTEIVSLKVEYALSILRVQQSFLNEEFPGVVHAKKFACISRVTKLQDKVSGGPEEKEAAAKKYTDISTGEAHLPSVCHRLL